MFSRRRPPVSEAESASTGTSLDVPAGDVAHSALEQQEVLRRRADEASAELDTLRQANQHLQELVRHAVL